MSTLSLHISLPTLRIKKEFWAESDSELLADIQPLLPPALPAEEQPDQNNAE